MSGSIRNRVALTVSVLLVLFVIISFGMAYFCIRQVDKRYQETAVSAALDFAELTIDPDTAKECFSTRNRTEEYISVQNKLSEYQANNSSVISRISLVSFSNSSGIFIYDSAGQEIGAKLDYNDNTSAVKAELINGRKSLEYTEGGSLVALRPIRTVDDALCGYIVVEMADSFSKTYYPYIIAVYSAMFVISAGFAFFVAFVLNLRIFRPLKRITDSAVYLSGDDSVSESSASAIFNNKRSDELGRLCLALQKIFFDMNSGAKNLSQALYDANHDGMTHHFNKRCYHSMEETFRSCEKISLIYFDVNNLKLMNDTNGHESGDYVIKRAADYIRNFVGEGDYCFRMGGDEFLLVMMNRSFREVDRLVDKLDRESPCILSRVNDSIKCSLSYGCAFSHDGCTYDELLSEAEENMYRKKVELKKLLNMPDR